MRPATAEDVAAMDELCRSIYGISRRNEISAVMAIGFPAFVRDRGRLTGYLIGTAMGHGVAETDGDMLALINSIGATMPDAHTNLPMRNGDLYRAVLAAGHRNRKVMNLMAYGPYEDPQGTFVPSVLF